MVNMFSYYDIAMALVFIKNWYYKSGRRDLIKILIMSGITGNCINRGKRI